MSHSFNKIWIHAVWSTKKRIPIIKTDVEKKIFLFVSNQLKELGCPVRIVNGMPDHIHCLFLMNPVAQRLPNSSKKKFPSSILIQRNTNSNKWR